MNTMQLVNYLEQIPQGDVFETVVSEDWLWHRLSELWAAFTPERGELMTVTLYSDRSNKLHVSFADGEWILASDDPIAGVLLACGDMTATGKRWVAFPEITQIHRKYLLQEDSAKQAISHWLVTGERSPQLQWR